MLDESTGKLVWPGTAEYEAWAEEEPEEEQMDLQVRGESDDISVVYMEQGKHGSGDASWQ
jgi:hypothetical protein